MYAIVRTGGKQYRVERGQTLLVERLPVGEGESLQLEPLLFVDGEQVVESGDGNPKLRVEARVVAHERGPKLRVVKFKPKRGYKRRTGHRQQLSRIEITSIEAGGRPRRARADKEGGETGRRSTRQRRATGERKAAPAAPMGRQQRGQGRPKEDDSDGS